MELKLLNMGKTIARIQVSESDETILYPLVSEILRDESVSDARYLPGHPQLDKPIIYVQVKKGKPKEVIRKAAKKLSEQFREARELLEEELK